jgi:hypothetical protein
MPAEGNVAASPEQELLERLENQARDRRRRELAHGLIRHAGVWLGVSCVLWGAGRVLSPGRTWPLWLAALWGAGLAVHALWTHRNWRASRRLE